MRAADGDRSVQQTVAQPVAGNFLVGGGDVDGSRQRHAQRGHLLLRVQRDASVGRAAQQRDADECAKRREEDRVAGRPHTRHHRFRESPGIHHRGRRQHDYAHCQEKPCSPAQHPAQPPATTHGADDDR